MKLIFFSLFCFLLAATACHNPDIASSIPKCISKEITENSKNKDWMVGSVKEYEFQGKLVYSFEPDIRRIADGSTTIKDAGCNTLCNVGGFGGEAINQCNGENFFKLSVYKRTIWEKR